VGIYHCSHDKTPNKHCYNVFIVGECLSVVYVVPTHFRPFMLINVVTFLLLAHNQMSQGCLYNKSNILLRAGLGDWSPAAGC